MCFGTGKKVARKVAIELTITTLISVLVSGSIFAFVQWSLQVAIKQNTVIMSKF